MHGVNLDQLGRRDPLLYGTLTLAELEQDVARHARELDIEPSFFHTNHEGAFVERLHALAGQVDAVVLNPGSWTHYAWSIRDALEIAAVPALEIHLSDVQRREPWRRVSVIADLCFATISGRGPDGYREALERVRAELDRLADAGGSAG
jgi:3-dehydroquinate dehydratase-2